MSQTSALEQPIPAARLRLGGQRQVALAPTGLIVGEPLPPARRGIDVLGAMLGDALAHPAQDGGVDRRAGDDRLALGEDWEFLEQVVIHLSGAPNQVPRICLSRSLGSFSNIFSVFCWSCSRC